MVNDTGPPRGYPWAPSIVSSVIGSVVLAVGAVAARNASAAPRTFVLLLVGAGCGALVAAMRVAPGTRLLALAAFLVAAGLASPSVLEPTGADDGSDVATSATRSTSPAGSSSTTTTTTAVTTTSPGPVERYLEDFDRVEYEFGMAVGPAKISGTTYERSVVPGFLATYETERVLDFDLGRAYTTLRVVVGVRDDSSADARVHFEIIADGKPIFSDRLSLGQTQSPVLDVTGVLRLQLSSTWERGDWVYAAWGDARVASGG